MRNRHWIPIVTVLALLGAACGGGDDEQSAGEAATTVATTGSTTEAPTTPPVTTAPPTAAPATTAPATTEPGTTAPATTAPSTTAPGDPLAAVAAGALLTIADFPADWIEVPIEPGSDDADDEAATELISACADVDALLIDEDVMGTARAESPSFSTPDGTFSVEQIAGFAPDEATAAASSAAIADPEVPDCYAEGIVTFFEQSATSTDPADTLPPGMELGDVAASVGDLSGFDLQADDALWFHVSFDLLLDGQVFAQHGDFVFLRNGAALTWLNLVGVGETFPADQLQTVVELADANLATIA